MKTIHLFVSIFSICISLTSFSQAKTETLKVSGACGMCKKSIEKAALAAGASYASWNTESKELKITYGGGAPKKSKIQKGIAAAGYDTPEVKATDEAYNKLHECCQYERPAVKDGTCCQEGKCAEEQCHKDGSCAPDMSCCTESGCATKDCCQKSHSQKS